MSYSTVLHLSVLASLHVSNMLVQKEISALEREVSDLRTQMDSLRAPLIAKLGRTINLDYEAEDAEDAAAAAAR